MCVYSKSHNPPARVGLARPSLLCVLFVFSLLSNTVLASSDRGVVLVDGSVSERRVALVVGNWAYEREKGTLPFRYPFATLLYGLQKGSVPFVLLPLCPPSPLSSFPFVLLYSSKRPKTEGF